VGDNHICKGREGIVIAPVRERAVSTPSSVFDNDGGRDARLGQGQRGVPEDVSDAAGLAPLQVAALGSGHQDVGPPPDRRTHPTPPSPAASH
jgi:hypothetical protein